MVEFNSNSCINVTDGYTYLVPNFTETKASTGWTLGGTVNSDGVAVLTGTRPDFTSNTFSVGTNDIVVVEFTISMPTPSTTASGPGMYIGTRAGQSVYCNKYDFSSDTWEQGSAVTTNPYFLNGYNVTSSNTVRTYVIGSGVSITSVPSASRTNTSYDIYCIKLSSGITETNIRPGYNNNTSMVINISNPRIYKLAKKGINGAGEGISFGTGHLTAKDLYEY